MVLCDWKLFGMSLFAKPNAGMTGGCMYCICIWEKMFYINLKTTFEGYKFIFKNGQRKEILNFYFDNKFPSESCFWEYFGFLLSSASKTGCIAKLIGASFQTLLFNIPEIMLWPGVIDGKPK